MNANLKCKLSLDTLEAREVPAGFALPSGLETQILFPVFTTGAAGKVGILFPSLAQDQPDIHPVNAPVVRVFARH